MTATLSAAWRNSAATVLAKGTLVAVRVGFLLWAARQYGPDAFGRLALCFSIVEVLRMVVDFGTEGLFLRNLARCDSRADQDDQLARFGTFRIAAISVGFLLYWVTIEVLLPGPATSIDLLPSILLLTSGAMGYALTYYQSQLQMQRAALLLMPLLFLSAAVLVVVLPQRLQTQLGLLMLFEVTAVVTLLIDMVHRGIFSLRATRQAASINTVRDVAVQSLPLAATALLATAYTRLDVLVIAPLAGSLALGLYSYAYRVSEPFRFLASAVDSTLYSYLSARIGRTGSRVAIGRLFGVVVCYAIIFSIAAACSGWLLVHVGYGEYRAALPTVAVLSVALFLRCINGFLVSLLYARGQYTTVLKIAICNAVLMAAMIYPLVSMLGIVGAAWSLLAVEVLNFMLQGRTALAARSQVASSLSSRMSS